jgi:hypothetical protein
VHFKVVCDNISVEIILLRATAHFALFGQSLVFSSFQSFVSCGVSVKTRIFNPLIVNMNDTNYVMRAKKS